MKINVYKKVNETPVLLKSGDLPDYKPKKKHSSFRAINSFIKENEMELFGKEIEETGIERLYFNEDHTSSYRKEAGVPDNYIQDEGMFIGGTFCPGLRTEDGIEFKNPVTFVDKSDADPIYIGVDIYEEGFVLRTGVNGHNMFGTSFPTYFEKFTSKNVMSSGRSDAKAFKDISMLSKFIKKNEDKFQYCVKNHGWNLSVESASKFFDEALSMELANMPEKKLDKYLKSRQDLEDLINQINGAEPDTSVEPVPDSFTPLDEALWRMDYLGMLGHCKKRLRAGELVMSEHGGILYDVNGLSDEKHKANALKAIELTKEMGGFPYHVIFTPTNIGWMYSVLYVSSSRDEWELERQDLKERAPITAVYNESLDVFECGSIQIASANGGLVREG